MLPHHTLTVRHLVAIWLGLLAASTAAAQSYPRSPTRLSVTSTARTLRLYEHTDLRVALVNEQGNEVGAGYDVRLNLIATRLKDIDSARKDVGQNAPAQKGAFDLPATRNTVQFALTLARGQSSATVSFSSQQSGTIRIFAASEKLATGSTLIAVLAKSKASQSSNAELFQTASFQDAMPAPLQLNIESDGTDVPPFVNGEWVRNLTVLLTQDGDPTPADEQIEVLLKVEQGNASFTPSRSVTIPRNEAISASVELHTSNGGDIKVSAHAVRRGTLVVGAAQATTFKFPLAKQATKLVLDSFPSTALANGLEAIRVQVRAVDDGNNPVRGRDEGLDARPITFRLAGQTLGVKFGDNLKVSIPKDESVTEVIIFGSCPISGTKIIAEASTRSGMAITGSSEIEFCFPWWQLFFAMLGGLVVPIMHKSWQLRNQPQQSLWRALLRIKFEGLVGALIGTVFFGFVFFGAVVLKELKLGGVPIAIASLPVQNWFAAFLIGFASGIIWDTHTFIKDSVLRRIKPAVATT